MRLEEFLEYLRVKRKESSFGEIVADREGLVRLAAGNTIVLLFRSASRISSPCPRCLLPRPRCERVKRESTNALVG